MNVRVWGKYYVLMDCFFDFSEGETRSFEMCVPYEQLVKSIINRPIHEQKMLKEGPCKIEIIKRDRGVMVVNSIIKYNDET